MKCFIPGCISTRYRVDKWTSFHRLPADQEVREKWLRICQLEPNEPNGKVHVCSKHFERKCFEYDPELRKTFNEVKIRNVLRKNAYPTLLVQSEVMKTFGDDEKTGYLEAVVNENKSSDMPACIQPLSIANDVDANNSSANDDEDEVVFVVDDADDDSEDNTDVDYDVDVITHDDKTGCLDASDEKNKPSEMTSRSTPTMDLNFNPLYLLAYAVEIATTTQEVFMEADEGNVAEPQLRSFRLAEAITHGCNIEVDCEVDVITHNAKTGCLDAMDLNFNPLYLLADAAEIATKTQEGCMEVDEGNVAEAQLRSFRLAEVITHGCNIEMDVITHNTKPGCLDAMDLNFNPLYLLADAAEIETKTNEGLEEAITHGSNIVQSKELIIDAFEFIADGDFEEGIADASTSTHLDISIDEAQSRSLRLAEAISYGSNILVRSEDDILQILDAFEILYEITADDAEESIADASTSTHQDVSIKEDQSDATMLGLPSDTSKLTLMEIELHKTVHFLKNMLHQQRINSLQEKEKLLPILRSKDTELQELRQSVQQLRLACVDLHKTKHDEIQSRVKAELRRLLTPNQIDLLLGLKQRVKWTAEEIAIAFTIRFYGHSVWSLLTKELNYPLPSLQSLRSWSANIKMHLGILEDVIKLMKIAAPSMSEKERVTVLSFDEVSVEKTVEYDLKNDQIIGPHSHMQVVMARGLFKNWKQPVFAAFDTNMTQEILNDIIIKLHEVGYPVVACVSDSATTNQGLWRKCGIDMNVDQTKTSITHPSTGHEVYFFADAPHLLKLIRNWILDHGFLIDGKIITNHFIEQLITKASTLTPFQHSSELNSLFKLSLRHFHCAGSERMNVRLAAQLLSHTTAVNLRRHFPEHDEAQDLANLIELVDSWFNTMNSYTITETVETKKCFGVALDQQLNTLDRMSHLIASMRTLKNHQLPAAKKMQVFQKGVLMSTNSIKKLFVDMKQLYGVDFIMTYKLNQDVLENLFGQIRQKGGPNNHPSPLDALYRLRQIILGKGLKNQLGQNQNCQDILIQENFVICEVFKGAKLPEKENEDEDSDGDIEIPDVAVDNPKLTMEEEDGFEYLMGFIASRLKEEHPELGSYTYLKQDEQQPSTSTNYVRELSFGGLTDPSPQFLSIAKQMDSVFNSLHNVDGETYGFKNKQNVRATSIKVLRSKFPQVSEKIIAKFVKAKINVRVRSLKKNLLEKKFMQSKFHNNLEDPRSAATRKNAQKLKHFTH